MIQEEQHGPVFYRHAKTPAFAGKFPQLFLLPAWLVFFLFLSHYTCFGDESIRIPEKIGSIDTLKIPEVSGIIKSRTYENVFWVHGDSGGKAALFPVTATGECLIEGGIPVQGVKNKDWEDIAQDCMGNIYIGDIGNNRSSRTDLSIIIIREPDIKTQEPVSLVRQVYFRFPDQKKIPSIINNFDAEALFWSGDSLYLYTKHRFGNDTRLYRFPTLEPENNFVTLEYVETFPIEGMVTAADRDCDTENRAVLTYNSIWLFKGSGSVFKLPIFAGQCEAVCLYEDTILIANEKGDIFRLFSEDLEQVR